jgi:hypothetical protein
MMSCTNNQHKTALFVQSRSLVARKAHNLEAAGSNPAPSTLVRDFDAVQSLAHLVERHPHKVNVAGSNPVTFKTLFQPFPTQIQEVLRATPQGDCPSPLRGFLGTVLGISTNRCGPQTANLMDDKELVATIGSDLLSERITIWNLIREGC